MTIREILDRIQGDLNLIIERDTDDLLEDETSKLQDAVCATYKAISREEDRDHEQERKEEQAHQDYEESRYAE